MPLKTLGARLLVNMLSISVAEYEVRSQAGSGVSGRNTMDNIDILNRNFNSCSLKEAKTM